MTLPKLPEPNWHECSAFNAAHMPYYTRKQVEALCKEAVEACARVCDQMDEASYPHTRKWPSDCAAAIRALKTGDVHLTARSGLPSTAPLSREHADAIHRMPFVRSCLLEYANRTDDAAARAVVWAVADQVQSLAESPGAGQLSTWQPMETAPKGERILMLMKHGAIEGQWDGETGSGYYWRHMEWYPSGWMPLPPAPESESGGSIGAIGRDAKEDGNA